jgi:hypothetical protein
VKHKSNTYAVRIAKHLCYDCEVPLPEGDKRQKCAACRERHRGMVTEYRNTPAGRRTYNRWMRKRRKQRRKAGVCFRCPLDAVKGKTMCGPCLAKAKAAQHRYMDRKEKGERLPPRSEPSIVPVPEPKPWQRVLRIATRFDVVTRADVCTVLEMPDENSSISHIFRRLIRKGYVRKIRGQGNSADTAYTVTPEGRAAA